MIGMEIYEDARTVSRADLAAWLRQLASQLESDAKLFYGAAGTVTVADQVHCELEIEREDGEISVEIEFTWAAPELAGSAAEPDKADTTAREPENGDDDENAEDGEDGADAASGGVGADETGAADEAGEAAYDADVTPGKATAAGDDAPDRAAGPTDRA